MDPGCLVKSRAGVGAGGLSPSNSLAGSFIFFGSRRRRALSAASRPGARRGCFGFASAARSLSRVAAFFRCTLDIWYKEVV